MKTHVITVSRYFPSTHPRKGEPTGFVEAIENKTKVHTIRGNYQLWLKRIEEVRLGVAILSLRYWEGKPYNSKQVEFKQLTAEDGVGIERLNFFMGHVGFPRNGWNITPARLAYFDGLTLRDFNDWFKGYDLSKPMAIIYFTEFRHSPEKPFEY